MLRDNTCGVMHLTPKRLQSCDKQRDAEPFGSIALELRPVSGAPVMAPKAWWTYRDKVERIRPLVARGLGTNAVYKEVGGDRNLVSKIVRELQSPPEAA